MERNVVQEMYRVYQAIREYLAPENEIRKDFNMTQLNILGYLFTHENEDTCQKDLEISTGLSKPSISETLDDMENKKAIMRCKSKEDGRRNNIVLTPEMQKRKKEMEDKEKAFSEMIIAGIPESDIESFLNVIDRILKNLAGRSGETDI